MKKPKFLNNYFYHIYNRGVEKRKIFMDEQDYYRFIHDLYEFNDENPTLNLAYYLNSKTIEVEPQYLKEKERNKKPRKLLVDILIFALMPNHFHLLVRQNKENGIKKFMQKLGTGYTMYFNKKYERVGCLFQGRFKAVLVQKNSHLIHLPFYIHTNPLDMIVKSEENSKQAQTINFLENYKWSSFQDYIGKKNFPSVIRKKFLLELFNSEIDYKKETKEWIKSKIKNITSIKDLILE